MILHKRLILQLDRDHLKHGKGEVKGTVGKWREAMMRHFLAMHT